MADAGPLSARAAVDLRKRIDRLAPGERLPTEAVLMAELGVGRSTLREAVRILEREGLLKVRQGSGTYVAEPHRPSLLAAAIGAAETADIQQVRRILEPSIAHIAAQRRTPDQAREILRLARLREELRAAGHRSALIEADVALHRAVANATNNPILRDLFDAFALVLERLVTAAIEEGATDYSATLHDRLASAVAIGDPEDAAAAVHAILDDDSHKNGSL